MTTCPPQSLSAQDSRGSGPSGLSIASSLGYRDANEASWTQLVESVERIVASTALPVLVDGDGSFGNFNNAPSSHANSVGVAGVSLEDSCFPKILAHWGTASARRYR